MPEAPARIEDLDRRQPAEQLQPGARVGDDRQGLVQYRDGLTGVTEQVVEVARPGVGDAGQFGVATAARHHGGQHGLGVGMLAGPEPGLAEHQARVDPAAFSRTGTPSGSPAASSSITATVLGTRPDSLDATSSTRLSGAVSGRCSAQIPPPSVRAPRVDRTDQQLPQVQRIALAHLPQPPDGAAGDGPIQHRAEHRLGLRLAPGAQVDPLCQAVLPQRGHRFRCRARVRRLASTLQAPFWTSWWTRAAEPGLAHARSPGQHERDGLGALQPCEDPVHLRVARHEGISPVSVFFIAS
jgi:hypothetical protein